MFIVSDSFVNKVPSAWESRLLSQEILYEIDHKIEKLITNFYSHVMTKEEIIKVLNNEEIDQIKIYQRSNNYILFNDEIITSQTFKQFCIKQSLENPEELQTGIVSELKGNIACRGKITGKAKIIHAARHLTKVKDGDILIATMTNANYSTAFAKAGAIITDEGGITSHAAILARELNKPCITGTKIATQIFSDGDLLLVDANSGIISRI
jgi:phosphohistidine swiveling domain-containing protein